MFAKLTLSLGLLLPAFAANLTVHEWGTFTSVAGEDGAPVSWAALGAPSDLPCFVYRLNAQCVKCNATSIVRMETPVIYFYSQQPTTVSVHVDLPSGIITEWYPKAAGLPKDITYGNAGKIDWSAVNVLPGAAPEYPTDGSGSHYYAARNTESAALQVEDQTEKLLFYRGVASSGVSLYARFRPDGKLELRGARSIPVAILFENRAGRSGYRVIRDLQSPVAVELPELTLNGPAVHNDLAAALTGAGLFPQEAAAMIDTWRDSWFEEGMRVFYILPRGTVDSVLPLKITPAPTSTVRVFVGRVELLSPAMQQSLRTALVSGDRGTLARYGRFLSVFAEQANRQNGLLISPAAQAFIEESRANAARNRVAPCVEPSRLPTDQQ